MSAALRPAGILDVMAETGFGAADGGEGVEWDGTRCLTLLAGADRPRAAACLIGALATRGRCALLRRCAFWNPRELIGVTEASLQNS